MNFTLYTFIKNIIKHIYTNLVFYKVEKNGWENIPKDKPLIFAVTHPLMHMDAVVMGTTFTRPLHFLTKSTVFNTPFKKWFFGKLNMIPVVRKQDGPQGEGFSNKSMFASCVKTLEKNQCLLIFTEGTSIWERKLRPLKSGTARIGFEAEDSNNFNLGVHIVPVALNYTHATQLLPSVSIDIAPAICVKDYQEEYKENPNKATKKVTSIIKERLLERYFTLNDLEEEDNLKSALVMLNEEPTNGWGRKKSLKKYFENLRKGVEIINTSSKSSIQNINTKLTKYNALLKSYKIDDQSLWKAASGNKNAVLFTLKFIFALTVYPIYIISWLINYTPYKLSKYLGQKSSDEIEVWGANMITLFGIFYPIFYGIYIFILNQFLAINGITNFCIFLVFPILTYLSFFMYQFYKKVASDSRVFFLSAFNKEKYNKLVSLRTSIVTNLENLINEHK
ncbi:1-acyl-sn-glycerol-3-phosphate acyltransferase [Flammeovirga kamogawensis]|uniref:1-acyl-sn-glycerol-3-phosphate acyltransferase n=1 Tax=Flammeovirga kamogawensis TaxID=373891 RepID=A0ABX8H069_9BACT|nr:1-acyl-sn-glycerol-3-phosphate acyltransferase [Flammeovirga kamogawensis]MBB6459513.1 1-acyl-sn-glycerol-3-phosphate acyltransferase [Flammeovirga kamogawensis]QWG09064.1 1-acyl-sn-glycerol-3-phosphate acyltransferase [Flammeovirga kamogawensis]TRX67352.1 hypothetical protein EO216_04040 [Flammeovirga kamogawensis]